MRHAKGDIVQPLRGKPQTPRPLDGEALPMDSPADRREALAKWITSPENPYFARAIANRIWANFMGSVWWKRWMIFGSPIRQAIRSCWMNWVLIW